MAKYYGAIVKTGKVGSSVFLVRHGVTIERQYQPSVANPSTPQQVAVRARMKLMAQLGAVMAPVIAIPRVGLASSRNMFVKYNFRNTSYADNAASVNLQSIRITNGVLYMPTLRTTRAGAQVSIELATASQFDRVVYCVFQMLPSNELRYLTSAVVTESGANDNYPATIGVGNVPLIVYAYGVRDNTEYAKAIFSNITTDSAEVVSRLLVTRSLIGADVTVTETRSAVVVSSE